MPSGVITSVRGSRSSLLTTLTRTAKSGTSDLVTYNRHAAPPGRPRRGERGGAFVDVVGQVTTAAGPVGHDMVFDGASVCAVGFGYFDFERDGDWSFGFSFEPTSLPGVGSRNTLCAAYNGSFGIKHMRIYLRTAGDNRTYLHFEKWSLSNAGFGDYILDLNAQADVRYFLEVRYRHADGTYTLDCGGLRTSTLSTGVAGQIFDYYAGGNTNALAWGGLFRDNNDAAREFFTGRVGPSHWYDRRITNAEVARFNRPGGYDPMLATREDFVVVEPCPYQVHQVVSKADPRATCRVSGYWTDAVVTPTGIEVEWNGNVPVALDDVVIDEDERYFEGTLVLTGSVSVPLDNQGDLVVRFENDASVTYTVEYVGVGLVEMEDGQSNDLGTYENLLQATPANGLKNSQFNHDYGIRELIDPTGGPADKFWVHCTTESGGGTGSIHCKRMADLADADGFPRMLVQRSVAGASKGPNASAVAGFGPDNAIPRSAAMNAHDAKVRIVNYLPKAPGGRSVEKATAMLGETDASTSVTVDNFALYFAESAARTILDTVQWIKDGNTRVQNTSLSNVGEANQRTAVQACAGQFNFCQDAGNLDSVTADDADDGIHCVGDAVRNAILAIWVPAEQARDTGPYTPLAGFMASKGRRELYPITAVSADPFLFPTVL